MPKTTKYPHSCCTYVSPEVHEALTAARGDKTVAAFLRSVLEDWLAGRFDTSPATIVMQSAPSPVTDQGVELQVPDLAEENKERFDQSLADILG